MQDRQCVMAFVAPRGIGPTAWNPDDEEADPDPPPVHAPGANARRDARMGRPPGDPGRPLDRRRSRHAPLVLQGERQAAGIALYASLFEPDVAASRPPGPAPHHREGPILLERPPLPRHAPRRWPWPWSVREVVLHQPNPTGWEYPKAVAKTLGWGDGAAGDSGTG